MAIAEKINYKLFLGCFIPARLPFIESSARKVFDTLGVELTTLEGASCCPDPTGIPAIDHEMWVTLGARNLSLVQNEKEQIMSLCSGCVETLKTVNHLLQHDPSLTEKVNSQLEKVGRNINGNVKIKHGGQLLFELLDGNCYFTV